MIAVSRIPISLQLLAITIVCIVCHWQLVEVGLALTNADFTIIAIESDYFFKGQGQAFYGDQNYGGVTLSLLRALWCEIFQALFGSSAYVKSHMSFSYVISPLLISWVTYFMVRQFVNEKAGFLVGLVSAVGFAFWVDRM